MASNRSHSGVTRSIPSGSSSRCTDRHHPGRRMRIAGVGVIADVGSVGAATAAASVAEPSAAASSSAASSGSAESPSASASAASASASAGASTAAGGPTCGTEPVELIAEFEPGFPTVPALADEFHKQFPNVTFKGCARARAGRTPTRKARCRSARTAPAGCGRPRGERTWMRGRSGSGGLAQRLRPHHAAERRDAVAVELRAGIWLQLNHRRVGRAVHAVRPVTRHRVAGVGHRRMSAPSGICSPPGRRGSRGRRTARGGCAPPAAVRQLPEPTMASPITVCSS